MLDLDIAAIYAPQSAHGSKCSKYVKAPSVYIFDFNDIVLFSAKKKA